jgi:beta-lactamase class C
MPDEVDSDAQMQAYFRNWTPDAAPGTQRRYSNPSIGLFGHLTARAAGRFCRRRRGQAVPRARPEAQLYPGAGGGDGRLRLGLQQREQGGTGQPRRLRCGGVWRQVERRRHDPLRAGEYRPGQLAEPMRQAVACTHTGYFQIGDTVQGLGWEQYRAPVSLAQLQAGNSEKMSRG